MLRSTGKSRGTGPRATVSGRAPFTVGRGPVPRHAPRNPTFAGDRPRAPVSGTAPFTVGRGPVPRHRFAVRPSHLCSSGSPDPDLFVIRRSQTTEVETHIMTMELAGDRPPRYGEKRPLHRRAWALACHTRRRAGFPRHAPVCRTIAGDRTPRYGNIEPRGLSYRTHQNMKHPHFT